MFREIIFLSFVLGTAIAARSANQYMDNVIQTSLAQELRNIGLNPAPLSNFQIRFGRRSESTADFQAGNVTGFDKVRRKGDCSGPKNVGGEITINCTLSIFPIATAHRVIFRNGSYVVNARNTGRVDESLVSVVIAGHPQNYIGSVKSYRVDRVGQLTPAFSQLPPAFNQYVKVLQDTYKSRVSNELFNYLQQRYVYAIGRAIAYKPMPRQ